MRLSLSIERREGGQCQKCDGQHRPVVEFSIVTEEHVGDAETLCVDCIGLGGLRVEVPMRELAPGRPNRRKALRKAKKLSQKQERDIAELLGGRTQPNSGAMRGAKGDVRKKGELRIEAKFTEADSYRLPLDDLWKIAGEASDGEKPLYIIDFLERGTKKLKGRFVVLHFMDLKELLDGTG